MKNKKRILVAPLNWGLGHATRCIPIINKLIEEDFEPVIASDGEALSMLKKEFPQLAFEELPAYDITYPKKDYLFKIKILSSSPKIFKTYKKEHKATQKIVAKHNILGIISDNRFGVYSSKLKSVFISHQLNVLSGSTTWISTKVHREFIKKFDTCWIPDFEGNDNLAGDLSHNFKINTQIKYIGPLSRFSKIKSTKTIDILLLLSGPEPQRTLLETKLLNEFKVYKGRCVMVRGVVEKDQKSTWFGTIETFNFMTSNQLEKTINSSNLIISRSGYTTVMDLAKLGKKAFFIPTPGQTEQEYLSKKFNAESKVPYCNQKDFKMELLDDIETYSGFKSYSLDLPLDLFDLFKVNENSLPTSISLST